MKETCAHVDKPQDMVYPSFLAIRMINGGRLLLPEILGQIDRAGAKTPIFNRYSLVAPHLQHLA